MKARDKKEKTKNKRGGGAPKGGDWDGSDDMDGGMGGFELTEEEREMIAREEQQIAEANAGGGVGGVEDLRRGAGGTFHELRCMEEDTPEGWDKCADWDLRIRSKMWWKDQCDRESWESLPSEVDKMFHACRVGAVPWVEELLTSGAIAATHTDPERWGRTPLHMAALRGNFLTGRLLLQHGADVNAQDEQQSTPLHCAAAYGRLEMCRMLLEMKAQPDIAVGFH